MDLPRATLVVPFARGLGQDVDPRVRPPDRLEVAQNCRSPVGGRLQHRYGFTKITSGVLGGTTLTAQGPVKALAATDTELLALGHRQLFAYNAIADSWIDRGHISPCIGRTREAFRAHAKYEGADVARSTSYVARAASRNESGTSTAYRLEYEVLSKEGDVLHKRTQAASGTTAGTKPRSPILVGLSDRIVMLWIEGDFGPTAGTLHRSQFRESTIASGFTALGNMTTNLFLDATADNCARTFHACPVLAGTQYLIAWIDNTTRDISLSLHAADGTQLQTSTITGTFSRVAVVDSPTQSQVYVLAVNQLDPDAVELYARRRSDLSAQWGPITLATHASLSIDNLGVAEGQTLAGANRVSCVWSAYSAYDNDGLSDICTLQSRSTDTSGGALDTRIEVFNCLPLSQPFWYRNRCYCTAAAYYLALGFTSNMLVDLAIGDSRSAGAIMVAAVFDVGQVNVGNIYDFMGSLNSVCLMPDGVSHRVMSPIFTDAIAFNDTSPPPRAAFDETEFTFDAAPLAAPCLPGCAVIGGGYNAWYDGSQTFELGFVAPPVLDSSTAVTAGGGISQLASGTTSQAVTTIWEHPDDRGNIHRSIPAPPKTLTIAANPDPNRTITHKVRTLPCTRRQAQDMSVEFYRSSSTLDEVKRRTNDAVVMRQNKPDNSFTDDFLDILTDANLTVRPELYTTGGVLEAVTPEGARIVHVAGERLVMGAFFRLARIQLSKVLAPGSVGEKQVAPELMEALGRIIHSGDAIQGISSIRDVYVVLAERHIFLVAGAGPDARGLGDDWSRLTEIPADWGCVDPRSVTSFPDGIVYRGKRCFMSLGEGFQVTPFGEAVRTLTDAYPNTTSAVVVPEEQQIRWTIDNGSTGIILVYDYRIGEFFEWQVRTSAGAQIRPVGAAYVDSTYYLLRDNGEVWKEDKATFFDDATRYVPMKVRLGNVSPAGPETYNLLSAFSLLADKRDNHKLTVRLYVDYGASPADTWDLTAAQINAFASPTTLEGAVFKPRYGRKGRAFSIELEDSNDGTTPAVTGEGYAVAAVGLQVATRGGYPKVGGGARA